MAATAIPGVDYAWSHPGGKALQAAKKRFACRYLSKDATKNLTRPEADDLAEHDVSCVVVWETVANRALGGRAAGISDAHAALTQATAAGMPSGRPIFFAVDWNATEAQQAAIDAYFGGVISVLGLARTGGYGGYWVIKRLFDAGLITFGWQTIAWSGGLWDERAQIRQGSQKTINGVSCDLNTATAADYGQWMPGKLPEVDVPLTDAEWTKLQGIVRTEVAGLLKTRLISPTDPKGGTRYVGDYIRYADQHAADILAAVKAEPATALTDTQVASIAAAVAASPVLAAAVATAVVDLEAKRLQS